MSKPTVPDFMNFILEGITGFHYPPELMEMDTDLSKTEFISLFMLEKKKGCTMSDLAESVSVPLSTATGIVDRLVKRGYVKRDRSEEDRRVVVVYLTSRGLEVIDRYREQLQAVLFRVISALTPGETEQLMHLMQKIYTVLSSPDSGQEQESSAKVRRIVVE